jgi:hypothetical protein
VLRAVAVADASRSREYCRGEYGRIRDVIATRDGELWFLTNNTNGGGEPTDDDDRILSVRPAR